eukprot:m.442920 g.442920  ORF g.442920 m.442920 type:complete len:57 (-) comp18876_c0_seq1:1912-2082(-)
MCSTPFCVNHTFSTTQCGIMITHMISTPHLCTIDLSQGIGCLLPSAVAHWAAVSHC